MEHIVLLWREVRELEMRQMVEEINLGFLTIEQAMVKYKVMTKKTVLIIPWRIGWKRSKMKNK